MPKGLIFDTSDNSTEYVKCFICGELFVPLRTKSCAIIEIYGKHNQEISICSKCVGSFINHVRKLKGGEEE